MDNVNMISLNVNRHNLTINYFIDKNKIDPEQLIEVIDKLIELNKKFTIEQLLQLIVKDVEPLYMEIIEKRILPEYTESHIVSYATQTNAQFIKMKEFRANNFGL